MQSKGGKIGQNTASEAAAGADGHPRPHRSRVLVDRALQFNLVTRTVILVLFVFSVIHAMLFAPATRELAATGAATTAATARLLGLHNELWPAAALCLLVAVGSALVLSHRIAGPLVRVKHTLRRIEAGQLPAPVTTRPRDYFKDEVQVLNGMFAALTSRFEGLKAAGNALHHAVDRGAAEANSRSDPGAQAGFALVHAKAAALSSEIETFTLPASPGTPAAGSRPPAL